VRTPARVAAFVAALGVTFGAAALVGAAVDPLRYPDGSHGHEIGPAAAHGGGHGQAQVVDAAGDPSAGLAVEQDGYRLAPEATGLSLGRDGCSPSASSGPAGAAVTDLDVEHARRMHVIVVRRDLSGFQHLHPAMDADGRWRARLRVPEAGFYRAYADFSAAGRPLTLATDVVVPGPFTPRPLPAPSSADATAGYTVGLVAEGLASGADAELTYDVSRGGAAGTTSSPISAPTATSSPCARATSPSYTSTRRSPRRPARVAFAHHSPRRAGVVSSCSSGTTGS
jgi:hypothetical protein